MRGKSTQCQLIWELGQGHNSHYYYYYLQRNPSNRSRARNDLILVYCWAYTDIWLTGRAKLAASPLMLKIPFSTFHQKINFLAEEFLKKAGDPSTLMLNNESQQSTFLFLKWPLQSRAPSVSQITNPLSIIVLLCKKLKKKKEQLRYSWLFSACYA